MARIKKHPGTLRLSGKWWQLVLWSSAEKKTRTFRLAVADTPRADLETLAWAKHQELQRAAKRKEEGLPDPARFSGFIDQFERERLPQLAPRARETYRISLDYFREFFVDQLGDPKIDAVRTSHVAQFLTWRRTRRKHGKGLVSERTVAKDRAVLHTLFAYAVELEMRDGNPVARTKAPKAETRDPVLLNETEYARLLSECREHDMLHLYTLVLAETGCRSISEALRLKFEDVDLEGGFLFIPSREHRTKSGKGRWVPMTPLLRDAIREHFARYRLVSYEGKRPAYLFHHTRSRGRGRAKMIAGERIRTLRSAMESAIERAKLPEGFRIHDLRHRRATTWLAAGKNPVHVKEALGHSDLRTTMAYTHLAREHLRSLVDEEPTREHLKELGA